MDNEEDYIELHKLLAKCKFNIARENLKLNPANEGHSSIIRYYEDEIKKINEFIVDIPIIKGEDK